MTNNTNKRLVVKRHLAEPRGRAPRREVRDEGGPRLAGSASASPHEGAEALRAGSAARGRDERGDLRGVLDAGARFDAARDVDAPRLHVADRGGDAARIEATGEHEVARRMLAACLARDRVVERL